ncbi:MAG: SCP2 sterol-binding domain-containing protein [Bdellovibrionota bacterium]
MPQLKPQEFFNKWVPEKLKSLSDITFPDLGVEMQVMVIGPGGGEWVLKSASGKPQVTAGKAGNALITMATTTGAFDLFMKRAGDQLDQDFSKQAKMMTKMAPDQEKVNMIREQLQGTMKFTITTNDGQEESVAVGFNGIDFDSPRCTIKTTEAELNEMREMNMPPQQAFMAGKIRLEGDMSLAMQAGMLLMAPQ